MHEGPPAAALASLRARGFRPAATLREEKGFISESLFDARNEAGERILAFGDIHGRDRIDHLLAHLRLLLARAGREGDLRYYSMSKETGDARLGRLFDAELSAIGTADVDAAILGYRGAVMNGFAQRAAAQGADPAPPDGRETDRRLAGRLGSVRAKEAFELRGGPHLPCLRIPYVDGAGRARCALAFRSIYGAATGLLVRRLAARGVRTFVLLGNCGGLSARARVGTLVAPTAALGEDLAPAIPAARRGRVANALAGAPADPDVTMLNDIVSVKVFSPLVETLPVVARLRAAGADVVDVESADFFRAASRVPGARAGCLLVVSDRPGTAETLAAVDEDAPAMLAAKKEMLDRVILFLDLRRFMTRTVR